MQDAVVATVQPDGSVKNIFRSDLYDALSRANDGQTEFSREDMVDKCWNDNGDTWAGAQKKNSREAFKGVNNFYFAALGLAGTGDASTAGGHNQAINYSPDTPENNAKSFISRQKSQDSSSHYHVGLHTAFDMNKVMGELGGYIEYFLCAHFTL
jgi:hypothetical protein